MIFGCKKTEPNIEADYIWDSLYVTATAYNAVIEQTDSNPSITAFGDSLKPGLKCVAVSRDLLRLGLRHNIPIKIEGLEGIYIVNDKMHSRWIKSIDVYMGEDIKAAKQWGRKRVCIDYGIPKENYN
ncbi:3D domain-containing protein [Flaviramulus aquimarinus]|uniref:3D domain-containing protein n=1 Tax=Flaviramulus aquimarinus TaxID=1170456 RepID=A0ABP9FD41_9FLAO